MSSPYRILLVEDHVMFREMIAGSLRHFPGLEIVGELGDGAELLKSIETTRPNLIVMDIEMPGLSGLEAAAKIKQTYTEIKILLLTMHKSIEHLVRALDARVDGYLLKENVFQDLIAAIDTIRDGRMYLSPLVTKELLDDFSKRSLAKPKQSQSLSNRETEVLKCVAEGKSNKEIAEALGISDSTVRIHLGRIKKKLELKTNVDLTRYAIKNGFVSSP
ncbi:MAG: response regulator transcription factor [Syntrophobacteraceae bacterium]